MRRKINSNVMRNSIRILCLYVCFSMVLFVCCTNVVYAATEEEKQQFGIMTGYGKSNQIVIYNELNKYINDVAFGKAIVNWNQAFSIYTNRYYLSQGTSLNVVKESNKLGSGVLGMYRVIDYTDIPNKTWRVTDVFSIEISSNSATIDYADKTLGESNWRISTFVHELGHAMSLADLDDGEHASGYGSKSIMSYDRNRSTMLKPLILDVSNAIRFK